MPQQHVFRCAVEHFSLEEDVERMANMLGILHYVGYASRIYRKVHRRCPNIKIRNGILFNAKWMAHAQSHSLACAPFRRSKEWLAAIHSLASQSSQNADVCEPNSLLFRVRGLNAD